MKAVAAERRRFGYRRIHVMLDRQGIGMNLKKLRRLYREEGLQVGKRGGRKRALGTRRLMVVPDGPNQRWSMDFVNDAFTDGRRFRLVAAVEDDSRKCLALVADTSLSGARVARELNAAVAVAYEWAQALKISPTAWSLAQNAVGVNGAAIIVMMADAKSRERGGPVQSVGGWVRLMAERAEAGTANLHRTLFGLLHDAETTC